MSGWVLSRTPQEKLLPWIRVPALVSPVAGVGVGTLRGSEACGYSRVGRENFLDICILHHRFWHLRKRSWKKLSHLIVCRIRWIMHLKSLLFCLIHLCTFPVVWEPLETGQKPGPSCWLLCLALSLCSTNTHTGLNWCLLVVYLGRCKNNFLSSRFILKKFVSRKCFS